MTQPEPDSPPAVTPIGSYYYDDATGYEIYDPAQDEDADDDTETSVDEPCVEANFRRKLHK